jgi:hypothetical protein
VLVATCLVESMWPHVPGWQQALCAQQTELLWDVAVIDGTDDPSPGYLDCLRRWSQGRPFGGAHRVRLLRVGLDAEGLLFTAAGYKLAHARRRLWEKFAGWASYDYLFSLALDVALPPAALQRLYEAHTPWAVAFTADAARPLRHSLLSGELVRSVPLRMALDSDLDYCTACAEQRIYPALVPVT